MIHYGIWCVYGCMHCERKKPHLSVVVLLRCRISQLCGAWGGRGSSDPNFQQSDFLRNFSCGVCQVGLVSLEILLSPLLPFSIQKRALKPPFLIFFPYSYPEKLGVCKVLCCFSREQERTELPFLIRFYNRSLLHLVCLEVVLLHTCPDRRAPTAHLWHLACGCCSISGSTTPTAFRRLCAHLQAIYREW